MSETTIDWGRSWESANEETNKLRAERDALAAENERLKTERDLFFDQHAPLAAENERLRKDAERWRWGVRHAAWLRHEHTAYIAIPVEREANLSCVAMMEHAIDAALAKEPTQGLTTEDQLERSLDAKEPKT